MSNIIKLGGGGGSLQVGEITLKDKSGDSNFLKCEGQKVSASDYPEITNIIEYAYDISTGEQISVYLQPNNWVYANGKYVGIDITNNNYVVSDDFVNWTITPINISYTTGTISRMLYGNGKYLFMYLNSSSNIVCMGSSDGISWTALSTHKPYSSITLFDVCFTRNLFIRAFYGASTYSYLVIQTSPDGITWTSRYTRSNTRSDSSANHFVYNDNVIIFFEYTGSSVGANCSVSSDAITWTATTTMSLGIGQSLPDSASGYNILVTSYSKDKYYTSIDGATWTARTYPVIAPDSRITFDGEKFIRIALNNYSYSYPDYIFISNDAVNWDVSPRYDLNSNITENEIFKKVNDETVLTKGYSTYYLDKTLKIPKYEVNAYIKVK